MSPNTDPAVPCISGEADGSAADPILGPSPLSSPQRARGGSPPINRSSIVPVAAALLIASLVAPAPTLAHAELVTADPLPNASLVDSPATLSITFSEPIDPDRVTLELLDVQLRPQSGLGAPSVDDAGTRLSTDLPDLDPDIYTVRYAVVSTIDGHATTGFFAFAVDPTGTQAPPTEQPASESPSADGWAIAARWLALLGALVSLGSLISWLHVGRGARLQPTWRLVGASALLSTAALAEYLVLSARTIPGTGGDAGWPIDIVAPFGWTPFAIAVRLALLAGLAVGIAATALAATRRPAPTSLIAGITALAALVLAGMSAAGHAASLGGPLNIGLDWLHLVAVAGWLGGLPAILVMARSPSSVGATSRERRGFLLRRHGRVALVAAPLVVLTGVANSPLVLGSARGLVASEYGNLLLAKATLASVAIGVGAVNHFLLRRHGRGDAARLIGVELLVAAMAVMTAAAMVTIQPAAARQDVVVGPAVQPAHFFGEAGPTSVHASISVPAPGIQGYQVTVRDAATGAPRDDIQRVFLTFTAPPESGLDPVRVGLDRNEVQGLFTANVAATPVVGEWTVDVIVRRVGANDESATFGMAVQEPGPPIVVPPPDSGIGVPAPLAFLWSLLPAGALGWLPVGAAVAAVLLTGRLSRRLVGLRPSLAAVALLLFLSMGSRTLVDAANSPTATDLAPYADAEPGDAERGRQVYLANCAACHGPDGAGDGPVRTAVQPAPLGDRLPSMSDAEVSYRIVNGTAGTPMPAFAASLTEAERHDLVAYLRQRWGQP